MYVKFDILTTCTRLSFLLVHELYEHISYIGIVKTAYHKWLEGKGEINLVFLQHHGVPVTVMASMEKNNDPKILPISRFICVFITSCFAHYYCTKLMKLH